MEFLQMSPLFLALLVHAPTDVATFPAVADTAARAADDGAPFAYDLAAGQAAAAENADIPDGGGADTARFTADMTRFAAGRISAFFAEIEYANEMSERCDCTRQHRPVCGPDGVTFWNRCIATCTNSPVVHPGRCCAGAGGRACQLAARVYGAARGAGKPQ